MGKIKYFFDYFRYIDNPIDALKFKFGFVESFHLKLKHSKKKYLITDIPLLNIIMSGIEKVYVNKVDDYYNYTVQLYNDEEVVTIDGINYINIKNSKFIKDAKFHYTICIEEYFSDDVWDYVDAHGRNVIDIGGNVGDTSLYFAKNGANVLGFEPVKHLYDLAIKNIQLNPNLKDKIQFVNLGVGGKRGTLNLNSISVQDYAFNDSYEMKVITLQDVLNNYNFPADILKMDCEGCEFEIIENNDLKMFNDIIFEHHAEMVGKDYQKLIKKLETEGFEIKIYPLNFIEKKIDELAIIHAYKK